MLFFTHVITSEFCLSKLDSLIFDTLSIKVDSPHICTSNPSPISNIIYELVQIVYIVVERYLLLVSRDSDPQGFYSQEIGLSKGSVSDTKYVMYKLREVSENC